MGDAPATKKGIAALQKEVDELRKLFLNEKKVVRDHVNDAFKNTSELAKVVFLRSDGTNSELRKLEKSTDATFDERKRWFEDEKKWTHAELDGLKKWVEGELKKLNK